MVKKGWEQYLVAGSLPCSVDSFNETARLKQINLVFQIGLHSSHLLLLKPVLLSPFFPLLSIR